MAKIAKQKIAIYLQNTIRCLEFLIKHPSLWHNQIYKPLYIYNENKNQVYNKIYTNK